MSSQKTKSHLAAPARHNVHDELACWPRGVRLDPRKRRGRRDLPRRRARAP
jgi:hypothetical protein